MRGKKIDDGGGGKRHAALLCFFPMLVSRLLQPADLTLLQLASARLECVAISRSRAWQELKMEKKLGGFNRKKKVFSFFFTSSRFSDVETLGRRLNADLHKKRGFAAARLFVNASHLSR